MLFRAKHQLKGMLLQPEMSKENKNCKIDILQCE